MSHQARGPARSETHASPVRVLSIKHGEPWSILFLGGYVGMHTHYAPKMPVHCEGLPNCVECKRHKRQIWKGYSPVLAWDQLRELWHPFVLELTGCLEEQLRGRHLRGELWRIERKGKGAKNDPLEGEFLEKRSGAMVIQPFDIEAVLKRMYHVAELVLGIPNTMPARLVLPAIAGDAPAPPVKDQGSKDQAGEKAPRESFRSMRERFERSKGTDQAGEDQAGEEKHETNGHHQGNGKR